MEKRGIFTRILAWVGTVLVWLPILAPILFGLFSFARSGRFRFDYLMPFELFPAILVGGGLLIWAALRVRAYARWVGWSLGVTVGLLLGSQALAVLTGLASGETEAAGWSWGIVFGSLMLCWLAIIALGVGGILLLINLIRPKQQPVTSPE